MDLGLRGRTALVAAASKGLGRAVAVGLAAEGANVVLFSRSEARIQQAAADVRAAARDGAEVLAFAADTTSAADLERVAAAAHDRFGGVDVLYNNAGGPRPGVFDELNDADWQGSFDLLLLSAIRLTRLCLPGMRQRGWGRVITGTSLYVKQPSPTLMLSNSLRSAVTAWSKTLADQVARDGVTVNTVAPGRIETERIAEIDGDTARRSGKSLEEVRRGYEAAIPVGRYGRPEELAAAVLFLASAQASFITGTTLLVDGGAYRGAY